MYAPANNLGEALERVAHITEWLEGARKALEMDSLLFDTPTDDYGRGWQFAVALPRGVWEVELRKQMGDALVCLQKLRAFVGEEVAKRFETGVEWEICDG